MKLEGSRQIFKTHQIPNFMKICTVGAELFHAEGRTGGRTNIMKPIVASRKFANEPKTSFVTLLFIYPCSNNLTKVSKNGTSTIS